jgi:2-phosphosulfolactate phosphatase
MNIEIIKSLEDVHKATGLAVVIDVFRAFSVEAYLFANGAEKIIPVLSLEEAYALKEKNPHYILIGERGGLKPDGFDFGNSPTEILNLDFSRKTIIHTTSNGTKGLLGAIHADEILAGSFLVADSIATYIKQNNFQNISLVSTAPDSTIDNEDILCAYYIRDILEETPTDETAIKNKAKSTPVYSFLLNEAGVPPTDIDLCLDFNKFNFVVKKVIEHGQMCLVKEDI